MARELNKADEEVKDKIKELKAFVILKHIELSDLNMGGQLMQDIDIIYHIWTKDENSI